MNPAAMAVLVETHFNFKEHRIVQFASDLLQLIILRDSQFK